MKDLFGNLAVRVKQIRIQEEHRKDKVRQWEPMCREITGILLGWETPVNINVKDHENNPLLKLRVKEKCSGSSNGLTGSQGMPLSFDLTRIRTILSQCGVIDSPDGNSWVKTSARTSFMTVRGFISLQPAPSKRGQFISLGIQNIGSLFGSNILCDEVNHLFASSSFGMLEENADTDGSEADAKTKHRRSGHGSFTRRQLKGNGKGVDRWPMFYIRIELRTTGNLHMERNYDSLKENTMSSIIRVLRTMIFNFLTEHHLRPRARQPRKRKACSVESPGPKPLSSSRSFPCDQSVSQTGQQISGASYSDSREDSIHLQISTHVSSEEDNIRTPQKNNVPVYASFGKMIGGIVKLPSFARTQSCHFREDFSSWRRIKSSGSQSSLSEIYHSKPPSHEVFPVPITAEKSHFTKAPSNSASRSSEYLSSVERTLEPSTCSPLTCEPQDVDTALVESSQGGIQPGRESNCDVQHGNGSEDSDDGVLTWTNPISKATVLINARTGIVIPGPSRNMKPTGPSSGAGVRPLRLHMARPFGRNTRLRDPSDSASPTESQSWAKDLLDSWDNPVFRRTEESIPQVSLDFLNENASILPGCSHRRLDADIEKAFRESPISLFSKISRQGLENATIIAQVDNKFVLVKMATTVQDVGQESELQLQKQTLVLIDQHAADERIRVEALLAELCKITPFGSDRVQSSLGFTSKIETTVLSKKIVFDISSCESRLFERHAGHFAEWGILYDLDETADQDRQSGAKKLPRSCRVMVRTLPNAIAERCRLDTKQLIDLLRGEIWKRDEREIGGQRSGHTGSSQLQSPTSEDASSTSSSSSPGSSSHWVHRIGSCPRGILDMLNSRSCRSAVMFNDVLTIGECKNLVQRLAQCKFPFQCAHGRPSMVPLVELGGVGGVGGGGGFGVGGGGDGGGKGLGGILAQEGEEVGFREAWRRWRGERGEDERGGFGRQVT